MAQPEKRFSAGPVSAAVFVNDVSTEKGVRKIRNVTLQRSYKDKDGTYKNTSSYGEQDIPKAIHVLQQAYTYLVERRGDA